MSSACQQPVPALGETVQQQQAGGVVASRPASGSLTVSSPPSSNLTGNHSDMAPILSYEGRLSLMSGNGTDVHNSPGGTGTTNGLMDFDQAVVLRRIKAECDSMLSMSTTDTSNFMADMSALYPAAAAAVAASGFLPEYLSSPPPATTPVRPPMQQMQHQTNDSGISPGSTGGATNSSADEKRENKRGSIHDGSNRSESGGDDPAVHSPSFSLSSPMGMDEEDDMVEEEEDEDLMDEGDEDEGDDMLLDAMEESNSRGGSSSDVVGDALSRLERALMNRQQAHPQVHHGLSGSILTSALPEGAGAVYQCSMCSYSATSRFHFQAHLNSHFDVKCTYCDFTARTEGKLRAHIRNAHSDVAGIDEDERNLRVSRVSGGSHSSGSKSKQHKCKHPDCGHVSISKDAFWEHTRSHIKAEKLLTCPHCPFVTEYKHHLDYHTRNHLNSKPFKCPKCSYACVNKSMLNSHMKSHSNVYQFRCKDCAYATKYQHSLKLHLRKYGHTSTANLSLLNEDGQPITKIKGRRGPKKPRNKNKAQQQQEQQQSPAIPSSGGLTSTTTPSAVAAQLAGKSPSAAFPFSLYSGHIPLMQSHPLDSSKKMSRTPPSIMLAGDELCKCSQCEFSTMNKEHFAQHLMAHMAADQHQRELANLFNASVDHLIMNNGSTPVTPLKGSFSSTPHHHHQVKDYLSRMLTGNPTLLFSSPTQQQPSSPKGTLKQQSPTPTEPIALVSPPAAGIKRSNQTPLDLSRENKEDPPATKHRRKGQAFKLERTNLGQVSEEPPTEEAVVLATSPPVATPLSPVNHEVDMPAMSSKGNKPCHIKGGPPSGNEEWGGAYQCSYCDIAFKDVVMYTMHMGYHGYADPFTCNMCGQSTHDKLAFFLHIARSSHC